MPGDKVVSFPNTLATSQLATLGRQPGSSSRDAKNEMRTSGALPKLAPEARGKIKRLRQELYAVAQYHRSELIECLPEIGTLRREVDNLFFQIQAGVIRADT